MAFKPIFTYKWTSCQNPSINLAGHQFHSGKGCASLNFGFSLGLLSGFKKSANKKIEKQNKNIRPPITTYRQSNYMNKKNLTSISTAA